MVISETLLLKIDQLYNKNFSLKPSEPNKLIEKIKNIIEVKPRVYYQNVDNATTAHEWPELDEWHELTNQFNIKNKKLNHYSLVYGKHKNYKYGDVFTCRYEKQPQSEIIQTTLKTVLKSHRLIHIRNANLHTYVDQKNKLVVIIIYK